MTTLTPLQYLAADAGSVDITVFAQYGVLGVIAALLIWFAKGAHQRERDRADRMQEKYEQGQDKYAQLMERVLPVISSDTRAVEESTEIIREMQRERGRISRSHERGAREDDHS